jgi:hypothetical protein
MALNVRRSAVAYKLNLELHLISRDGFATYHAGLTDAGSARRAVRSSRRQLSSANRFSSLVTKNGLVGHGQPPTRGEQYRAWRSNAIPNYWKFRKK